MRNLVSVSEVDKDLGFHPEFGRAVGIAVDEENKFSYICSSTLQIVCLSNPEFPQTEWHQDVHPLADEAGCSLPLQATLTSFAFVPELDALSLCLSTGHLLLLYPNKGFDAAIEEVGVIQGGILAAAWSPDGEVFAIVGGLGQIMLMTSNWDVLWEKEAENNTPEFPQPTSPPGSPLPSPPTIASLSWRGDGKFLAVCTGKSVTNDSNEEEQCSLRVRVWTRETGELHSLGEPVQHICPAISWQPNNRHIYVAQHIHSYDSSTERPSLVSSQQQSFSKGTTTPATQNKDHAERGAQGQDPEVKYIGAWKRELQRRRAAEEARGYMASPNKILLFERNGLQHGDFDIACLDGKILALQWSPDSSLLAIVLQRKDDHNRDANEIAVQLWHRSNWHWYMKYERVFQYGNMERDTHIDPSAAGESSQNQSLNVFVSWSDFSSTPNSLVLRLLTSAGLYVSATFVWAPCVSPLGTAAVVDHRSVFITPLRLGIIPPPMCAVELKLPRAVSCIALCYTGGRESIAAVLSDGSIAVSRSCEDDYWEETLGYQLDTRAWNGPGSAKMLPDGVMDGKLVMNRIKEAFCQCMGGYSTADTSTDAREVALVCRSIAWMNAVSLLCVVAVAHTTDNNDHTCSSGDMLVELELELDGCPVTPNPNNASAPMEPSLDKTGDFCSALDARVVSVVNIKEKFGERVSVVTCTSRVHAPGALVHLKRPSKDDTRGIGCTATGNVVLVLPRSSHGNHPHDADALLQGDMCSAVASLPETCYQILSAPPVGYRPDDCDDFSIHNGTTSPPAAVVDPITVLNNDDHDDNSGHYNAMQAHYTRSMEPPAPKQVNTIGLSSIGRLYLNSTLLAKDATSFALRSWGPGGGMLTYTRHNHTMATIPLHSLLLHGGADIAPQLNHEYTSATSAAATTNTTTTTGNGILAATIVRATEDDALLVAVPADGVDVVYQAPRGNLETVRPRALVLPAVAALLDESDYKGSWKMATVNRLDLNILVDYRWPRFLYHAADFLLAVGSDMEVATFIASLNENSCVDVGGAYHNLVPSTCASNVGSTASQAETLLTLLPRDLQTIAMTNAGTIHNDILSEKKKVERVCRALREALIGDHQVEESGGGLPMNHQGGVHACDADAPHSDSNISREASHVQLHRSEWLRTELMSHAACNDLVAALLRVQCAKESELSGSCSRDGGGDSRAVSAEQGLKYLMLHSPEEEVYRAALSSYELELAYMVISHSQRDPGEYLLELQSFASITDQNYRKHAIDLRLRRYDSALRHIVRCGKDRFEEAIALAREHDLLRTLLSLTQDNDDLRARVHVATGEELERKNKHEDAALAFMAGGEEERALRAYRLAGQWRPSLTLATRLGRTAEEVRAMAARMATDLEEGFCHKEAAQLILEHLEDIPRAIHAFAAAGEWRECVRLTIVRNIPQCLERIVLPSALSAVQRILESLDDDRDRIAKYVARIKDLRTKRLAMAAVLAARRDGTADNLDDDMDVQTETASVVSNFSVYTDRTLGGASAISAISGMTGVSSSTLGGRRAWAAKKKESKAKRRIRQGTASEEAHLAKHVLSLTPLPSLCTEVGQLSEALVWLGRESNARSLQRALKTVIDAIRDASEDILSNPPPGEGLMVTQQMARDVLTAVGGHVVGVTALEHVAGKIPSRDLQKRVAQNEARLAGLHWKWEILRDPEST